MLGQTSHAEPLTAPAAALLARVRAAGLAGYRLRDGDPLEILAAFDLYRRNAILPIDDWTYRARDAA